jgi:hypothetical protein
MNIFGIGLPEMAVIAAIGLLVFGPKRSRASSLPRRALKRSSAGPLTRSRPR